jgi:hypothetical protein
MARSKRIGRLFVFWEQDHGLSLLAVLMVCMVFGAPILHLAKTGRVVFELFLALLLLTGVGALGQSRLQRSILGGLALATCAARFAFASQVGSQYSAVGAATALAFFTLLAVVVARRVFVEGDVSVHRIFGAVALYLILGLTWWFAYETIATLDPGSFAYAVPPETPFQRSSELIYFSFVTLTTVGYGDVTAVHPLARSVAMLEALIGQLFPAITLARLVALEVGGRTDPRGRA